MLLPAPEGPTKATVSPGSMASEKPCSARSPGREGYWNSTASRTTLPRGGSGRGRVVPPAAWMAGRASSSSINRSVAPAARCTSPHTWLRVAAEPATKIA